MDAEAARAVTDTHTHTHTRTHTHTHRDRHTQDNYSNPSACTPRVNKAVFTGPVSALELSHCYCTLLRMNLCSDEDFMRVCAHEHEPSSFTALFLHCLNTCVIAPRQSTILLISLQAKTML